jgi:hypothetical protein
MGLAALAAGSLQCSTSTGPIGPPPCQTVYADAGHCGISCTRDNQCGPGLYCAMDGHCTADCAPGAAMCQGGQVCSVFGRCVAGASDGGMDAPGGDVPCVGLACQQVTCSAGATTSVSGVVTIPAGTLPLYGVTVYIPNGPLAPVHHGATCDRCDAPLSGNPLVQTTTDTHGRFSLTNVPVGQNIHLVVQVGRWRREATIPAVAPCVDTPVAMDLTRLPRHQGEGELPQIALTTGGADPLECLLRKVGIDQREFTPESGNGRVHFYVGAGGTSRYSGGWNGGAQFSPVQPFWSSVANLSRYDMVLLACEGGQHPENKGPAALQALRDYTTSGGRVFASHWHNYWLEQGAPPWPMVATFNHQPDLADPFTATIDTSFPKGLALAEWLMNVGGSTRMGDLVLHAAQHTVDDFNPMYSQRWIYSTTPRSVQYLTFNTPLEMPAANRCGRVVFSDIHVSSGDAVNQPFPNGCTTRNLSPQEMTLIFMLFDLSACISDDLPG